MSGISLCLIARDEEAMLPGCLASVRGAVDEVVVVDTGSRDRTAALARAAGARLVEHPWRDFADARNAALAAATGAWALVLDADERLASSAGGALRAHAADPRAAPVGFLRLHDATRLDASPEDVLSGRARQGDPTWLPRMLRRTPDLRFEGAVHESVESWHAARGFASAYLDADILHPGAARRAERGNDDRNLALLRARCAEETASVTPFGHLAVELLARGQTDEAWAVADRGWALLGRQPPWRLVQRLAAARALAALERGDWAAARASAAEGARRDGETPDLAVLRGWAAEREAEALPEADPRRAALLAEAADAHRTALAGAGQARPQQVLLGATRWVGHTRLGTAQLLAGAPREALASFDAALAARPGHLEAVLGRAEALLALGDAAGALAAVDARIADAPDGWALAGLAAAALGARSDARALLGRALQTGGRWVRPARRPSAARCLAGLGEVA